MAPPQPGAEPLSVLLINRQNSVFQDSGCSRMMFGARTKSALGQKQDPLSSSSIAGDGRLGQDRRERRLADY